MALFLCLLSQSQSLNTDQIMSSCLWHGCRKKTISHPFLFTQFHFFTVKHYTTNPPRNSCLHLTENKKKNNTHLFTNASTGSIWGTIKEYVISFYLSKKNLYNGLFDLVNPSPKEIQWNSQLVQGNNGFPKDNKITGRKGGIYTVTGYLLKCRSKPFLGIALVRPYYTGLPQTSALIAS